MLTDQDYKLEGDFLAGFLDNEMNQHVAKARGWRLEANQPAIDKLYGGKAKTTSIPENDEVG
jgi:hypothetical protein